MLFITCTQITQNTLHSCTTTTLTHVHSQHPPGCQFASKAPTTTGYVMTTFPCLIFHDG